jgi:hypothetical protein
LERPAIFPVGLAWPRVCADIVAPPQDKALLRNKIRCEVSRRSTVAAGRSHFFAGNRRVAVEFWLAKVCEEKIMDKLLVSTYFHTATLMYQLVHAREHPNWPIKTKKVVNSQYLKNLVESMPKRLQDFIQRSGNPPMLA